MRRGWPGEGGGAVGRMVPEAGARSFRTKGGRGRWRRASGARAGEAACDEGAPGATGHGGVRSATGGSLACEASQAAPDGRVDAPEPSGGALGAASW